MCTKVAFVLGLLGALWGSPAVAGLYNTAEPAQIPANSRDFRAYQELLIPLRQIAVPTVQSSLRRRYELLAQLAGRGGSQGLTVEQRLDLSAYLIRLQKFREAVNLLTPAQAQERDNFLVLANLATAENEDGQLSRARDYQEEVLHLWPKEWSGLSKRRRDWFEQIGWKEKDFRWFREVETYQLKLLRLRAREALRPTKELPGNVDGLFEAQFVGPGGTYEAGKLAPEQRGKLPPNAIAIVEQMLLWTPFDTRLYWLLGELYNAEGDVPVALAIIEEVASKWDPSAATKTDVFKKPVLPKLLKEHLAMLRVQAAAMRNAAEEPPSTQTPAAQTPPVSASPPVDWKSLGVGFAGGIAVAILASWQFRELRRRNKKMAPQRLV